MKKFYSLLKTTVLCTLMICMMEMIGIAEVPAITSFITHKACSGATIVMRGVHVTTSITSFNPPGACSGVTTISIFGSGFTGTTGVTIGGVAAGSFTVNSDNNITATVTADATGTIAVTGSGGTAISSSNFTRSNSYTPFAYVANYASGTVNVINTANNTVIATVTVGGGPTGVCISPDGTKAYVTNQNDGNISVINTAGNTVVATIPVGNMPNGVCISPNGTKAYVTNQNDGTISVINTASNMVTATINVGSNPIGVCVSPDGTKVYVVNRNDYNVSVINTTSNTVTATVAVGSFPIGVIVSPDGTKAYVANSGSNNVSVINTASNTVTATVAVGSFPYGVSVSPDGTKVYVANYFDGTISAINTASNTVTTTVTVGNSPVGVSVSPDGTKAYVTNQDDYTVSIINTATNTVTAILTVVSPSSFGNFIANVPTACPTPAITGFSPKFGGTGTTVTISGSRFTGATGVTFGGTGGTNVTVVNDNTITAKVDTGSSGKVCVSTGSGTGCSVDTFIYFPPYPVITSFTPTSGTTGTIVTIKGSYFTGVRDVMFGGTWASSVNFIDDNTITAVVGNGSIGSIAVIVHFKDGNSTGISSGIFTYLAAGNTAPVFVNTSPQALSICENASATSINTLLSITDPDAGQTETFSVTGAPLHGSITVGTTVSGTGLMLMYGSNARGSRAGTSGSPTGWSYTPASGYSGTDVFTIQVNDGNGGTASTTVNVTVNAPVTPSVSIAANPSGSIVAGTSVTFTATPTNGGSSPSYQWKKNSGNVGTNSNTYTDAGLVNNDVINCVMTANNSCQTTATANSNNITETVTASVSNYVWTGATSTDWSVATNWSNNVLPTTGVSVTIPSAPTNQPVLSTDVNIGGIALNGSLAINGHTFTITGAVTGTGKLKGSATSSLVVNSNSINTLYFGTTGTDSMLANLTVSGTGILTLGSGLGLTNLLTVNTGTLNTGNHLTLKSTSIANTAVVGPVSGSVTGTVTVERFIPKHVKSYQSLTTGGVYNAGSIFKNWQEGGVNTNGYGIFVTGKKGTVPGVDVTTGLDISPAGNISMYNYTNYLTYTPVTTTKNTNLDPYTGYLTVVYGNRALPLIPSSVFDASANMNAAATIRTTGSLVTGTVTFDTTGVKGTVGSNFNSSVTRILPSHDTGTFIANPYACAIDWNNLSRTNLNNTYYYYEPTYLTGGYQAFVCFNSITGSNNPNKSKINRYIQPGQGFWVQTDNTVSKVNRILVINESNKVTNQPFTAVFGTGAAGINRLAMSLWKNGENIDGAVAAFDNNFTSSYGDEDSKKMFGNGPGLYITEGLNNLSIDGIPTPAVNDRIALIMSGLTKDSLYEFHLDAQEFNSNGLTAYLEDAVLNTETVVGTASTVYSFTAKAASESRFTVVFRQGALPVHFVTVKAKSVEKKINAISWTVSDEVNIARYEVEQSFTGKDFIKIATVKAAGIATYTALDNVVKAGTIYYRIKAIDNSGKDIYSNVVTVVPVILSGIVVTPNPVKGNKIVVQLNNLVKGSYVVELYNTAGQLVLAKEMAIDGTTTIELPLSNNTTNGLYNLQVKGENNYKTEIIIQR